MRALSLRWRIERCSSDRDSRRNWSSRYPFECDWRHLGRRWPRRQKHRQAATCDNTCRGNSDNGVDGKEAYESERERERAREIESESKRARARERERERERERFDSYTNLEETSFPDACIGNFDESIHDDGGATSRDPRHVKVNVFQSIFERQKLIQIPYE